MPVHDWSAIPAGMFHDFHHGWIEEIKRALNRGGLPADFYASVEQRAGGFEPDVIALQGLRPPDADSSPVSGSGNGTGATNGGIALAAPRVKPVAESLLAHRKASRIVIRHVSDDRVVAMVEVVSPANKNNKAGIEAFIEKTCELIEHRIHLLILDLLPPGPRDPRGLHDRIWEYIEGVDSPAPTKPLSMIAYESGLTVRAFVESVAVGEALPEMPLFLEPDACVHVPLEATYMSAVNEFPRRWRHLLK